MYNLDTIIKDVYQHNIFIHQKIIKVSDIVIAHSWNRWSNHDNNLSGC